MKYYKVKPEYADTQVTKIDRYGRIKIDRYLVANELYTPYEFHRMNIGATYRKAGIKDDTVIFDIVEINKNTTYWFFGARFEG